MNSTSHQDLDYGITRIDVGYLREQFAAAYLIVEHGRAVFVDTGTFHSVPRLLDALQTKGIAPEQVDFVMPTHVHLDHAGGAGELMRRLPNARLVIHRKGARHMIDPAKLIQGATAVYGEAAFKADFGTLVPVPKERVLIADDGFSLDFHGRRLEFLDTPGHASHHYCVWDECSSGFFTGDTFGLSYRELDVDGRPFVIPTTTPVQFKPELWRQTLVRLADYDPNCIYLTHFGRVSGVSRLMVDLERGITRFEEIARECHSAGLRYDCIRTAMAAYLCDELRKHGLDWSSEKLDHFLSLDLDLNTQGLEVWLDRRKSR